MCRSAPKYWRANAIHARELRQRAQAQVSGLCKEDVFWGCSGVNGQIRPRLDLHKNVAGSKNSAIFNALIPYNNHPCSLWMFGHITGFWGGTETNPVGV